MMTTKHEPTHAYWQQQSPDVRGMMLNSNATKFEHLEREEVLSLLPDVSGLEVLELAAGIGRFTGHLAAQAAHVTAVDFVGSFIEENHKTNQHHQNITFLCSDVMELERETASVDFVFINWLMMYLERDEVAQLLGEIHRWLRPNGRFFFRESCISPSDPNSHHPHSHYRDPAVYTNLLDKKFIVLSHGNIQVYQEHYNNPNQLWWLCQKC